jgi:hypothetical protein
MTENPMPNELDAVALERDRFEEWAASDHRCIAPEQDEERTPENGLYYQDDGTNHAYIGWRERAALSAKPAQAGELPDDLRIPLHGLQTDREYLVARIRKADDEEAALLSESIRNRLSQIEEAAYRLNARTFIDNPPRHQFWGAGEPDCPRDIKAPNGELHTLRCKVCGQDDPRDDVCRALASAKPAQAGEYEGLAKRLAERSPYAGTVADAELMLEAASAIRTLAAERDDWKRTAYAETDRAEAAEALALSLETRLAAMGEALKGLIELVEMDDEFNSPGTDAYTALHVARAILSTEVSHHG